MYKQKNYYNVLLDFTNQKRSWLNLMYSHTCILCTPGMERDLTMSELRCAFCDRDLTMSEGIVCDREVFTHLWGTWSAVSLEHCDTQ